MSRKHRKILRKTKAAPEHVPEIVKDIAPFCTKGTNMKALMSGLRAIAPDVARLIKQAMERPTVRDLFPILRRQGRMRKVVHAAP